MRQTQYQMVSSHLAKHRHINTMQAMDLYGVQNLSAIISEIKKYVVVKCENVPWVNKATGRYTTVAMYCI